MGARVRVSDEHSLEVIGHGDLFIWDVSDEDGAFVVGQAAVGAFDVVAPAYLYSLRQALLKWKQGMYAAPTSLTVNVIPGRRKILIPRLEEAQVSPALVLKDERLLVRVVTTAKTKSEQAAVHGLLAPFLKRHKALSEDVEEGEIGPVAVEWPTKGRTVADALAFGEEVEALLAGADGGELTPALVLDLLRAGRRDFLLGQPESDWLEAKGEPYDRRQILSKYEMAKDVAAFANSPEGGIVVIGMFTRKRRNGDVIHRYKEFDLDRAGRSAYRSIVADRVYPRVSGFEVERIEGTRKDWGLAVLVIPPQPEASGPFLVQGTLLDGKVQGNYVLLPVRREADTASMDAATLHARLRLGEQVIAGKHQRR
jgi:hypothetical protein